MNKGFIYLIKELVPYDICVDLELVIYLQENLVMERWSFSALYIEMEENLK